MIVLRLGVLPVADRPSLIAAFASVAATDPSAELVLVGGSGNTSELEGAIRASAVEDRVRILTGRTDMPDVMAAFDIFVHPSLAESFGYVIIYGNDHPGCLDPDVGIAEEVITDGESGVLINGSDSDSIRALDIEQMLSLRERWPELGAQARRRALAFTPDKWVSRHELAYEEWLAGA